MSLAHIVIRKIRKFPPRRGHVSSRAKKLVGGENGARDATKDPTLSAISKEKSRPTRAGPDRPRELVRSPHFELVVKVQARRAGLPPPFRVEYITSVSLARLRNLARRAALSYARRPCSRVPPAWLVAWLVDSRDDGDDSSKVNARVGVCTHVDACQGGFPLRSSRETFRGRVV